MAADCSSYVAHTDVPFQARVSASPLARWVARKGNAPQFDRVVPESKHRDHTRDLRAGAVTRPSASTSGEVSPMSLPPQDQRRLLFLQRAAGNQAVSWLVAQRPVIQREPGRDRDDDPRDRSRRARPRDAPPGTVPIDSSGLDRETIHKIKRAIGAAPDTWVGITPDGHIVTGDSEGNVEDHGHISDYARSGSESIPKWVWGMIGFAAMIALIVLFATGVGEVGLILAGAGAALIFVVSAALRAAGRKPGLVAAVDAGERLTDEEVA